MRAPPFHLFAGPPLSALRANRAQLDGSGTLASPDGIPLDVNGSFDVPVAEFEFDPEGETAEYEGVLDPNTQDSIYGKRLAGRTRRFCSSKRSSKGPH